MLTASDQTERGSVALAMMVLMLMTMLGLIVIGRSQGHLETAARGSDAAAAQAGAEQGLAEALALVGGGQRADFSGSGDLAGGAYRYEATATTARSFEVYAEADVDGVVRAVEAVVGGRALYPYTLFIDTAATLEGNLGTVTGRVGSNGPLQVTGAAPGDSVDLYGASASCTGCPTTTVFDAARDVPSPNPTANTFQACPADGIFSGPISGRSGIPVLCEPSGITASQVVFTGSLVVVDGPLIIHVVQGLDVEIYDATINAEGTPSDFQLLLGGSDTANLFSLFNTRVDGVIYAPGRNSTVDQVEVVGSLTLGELHVGSGSSLSIRPSAELDGFEVSGWQMSAWEQVVPR